MADDTGNGDAPKQRAVGVPMEEGDVMIAFVFRRGRAELLEQPFACGMERPNPVYFAAIEQCCRVTGDTLVRQAMQSMIHRPG